MSSHDTWTISDIAKFNVLLQTMTNIAEWLEELSNIEMEVQWKTDMADMMLAVQDGEAIMLAVESVQKIEDLEQFIYVLKMSSVSRDAIW